MDKNKRVIVWVVIVLVLLGVLFMWPRVGDPTRALVAGWKDANVDCLPSHQRANLHIHPVLRITVDGAPEPIPAETGIVRSCMAEIHTHDGSGTLHVESVLAAKAFTLGQFFTVWGKELTREGYSADLTVNGAPSNEFGNLLLLDHQDIRIDYKSLD